MNKELKIHAAVVTVKMVTVDGKKMTKATYDQIRNENPIQNGGIDFEEQVIGYVYDSKLNREIVLYINKDGDLRKTDLHPVKQFATGDIDNYAWRVIGLDVSSYSYEQKEELKQCEGVKEWIDKAKVFWELVLKNQVFIAT